ncbi:hypothetical protein BR63_12695 [Thermanaerosceptrum fracticalcis]|uniref:Uncharacterized protein n=1 Tax=Thermanaerosceptrum fracticalcis TaxID=1712410 RepID=A0A7G6E4T5_THEFR|nr:hypothetical protein [Thermanaerosceptrum fracticalcis]QNB47089.1 hypothetical protein BR63_12695 [Thermanaerosceptrum fracticalcis]
MLNCLWRKLTHILAKPQFSPPMEEKMDKLIEKLTALEKSQEDLYRLLAQKSWVIEKIIIEKMHNDKLEFRLDTIDVKELSGMLNIGVNHGGNLIKHTPDKTINDPGITPVKFSYKKNIQAPPR